MERVAVALEALDDREIASLLAAARTGQGIGGAHAVLELADTRVFAKSIPLTDLERDAPRTTANLFDLPAVCHYGVGSPGISAWREVAAHELTTRWALEGEVPSVPLRHHARLLPSLGHEIPSEHADVEAVVAFFGGDRSIARRLQALATASWSLVLFLEYVPWTVEGWLTRELGRGPEAAGAAIEMLERELPIAMRAMNDRGLVHFDGHLRNILTDGDAIYVSDFGLASSLDFDLSDAERHFLNEHRLHDPAYAIARLVNQVVTALSGAVDPDQPDYAARNAYIRRCARGADPGIELPAAAALVARYAPLARAMNDFSWRLFEGTPFPPFPRDAVAAAWADAGDPPTPPA